MEKNIMYNFTSEDHRIRLENIRLIETNMKSFLKKNLITDYEPAQYVWPAERFDNPEEYEPKLRELAENGVQLIQTWSDVATRNDENGKKIKVENKEQCDDVVSCVTNAEWVVSKVKKSTTQSKPQPPFTTSTMQQDAIAKLGMSSSEVMKIAQQLYEGFNIEGIGHVALVTYIRTDSVRVSDQAIYAARNLIASKYGAIIY